MATAPTIINRGFLVNSYLTLIYDKEKLDELFSVITIDPLTDEFSEETFVKILREFDAGPQLSGTVHNVRAAFELAQRARFAHDSTYLTRTSLGHDEPIDPRILLLKGLETAIVEAAVRAAVNDRNESIINFNTILPEIVGNKLYFGTAITDLESGFGLPDGFPLPFPQFPSDPIPDLQDSELTGALGTDALGPTNIAKDTLEATIIGMIGTRVNPILLQVVALTLQVDILKRVVKQLIDKVKALGG